MAKTSGVVEASSLHRTEVFVPHRNARLTVHGRRILVERVLGGRPVAHVAAEMGISRPTAHKWVRRWRAEGETVLVDRRSDTAVFAEDTTRLVDRYGGTTARDFDLIALSAELFASRRRNGVYTSSEFVFPLLAPLMEEQKVRRLDSDTDFQAIARPRVFRAAPRPGPPRRRAPPTAGERGLSVAPRARGLRWSPPGTPGGDDHQAPECRSGSMGAGPASSTARVGGVKGPHVKAGSHDAGEVLQDSSAI